MRHLLLLAVALLSWNAGHSQGCCSGGAGSPIAGGAATGVLQKSQVEISGNYQYTQSNKFLTQDRDTNALFDNLTSNYLYFRVDYGLSKKLTMSVATGYFMDRTLVELEGDHTISSSGIGDLILFPRYDIYNKTTGNARTEVTLGLGLKLPLGSCSDSNLVLSSPIIGDIYAISPPTVQATTGSQDLMFYTFVYRGYPSKKLRFFANGLYVMKSYNSLGEKFGDYASVGLFAGKTITRKLGITLQVKGEWVGKMQAAYGVDLLASYNVEQVSTGGRKVLFVPQVSYTHRNVTAYVTSEVPLYQYLEGTQVASQNQLTTGLNIRFFTQKPECRIDSDIELAPVPTDVN